MGTEGETNRHDVQTDDTAVYDRSCAIYRSEIREHQLLMPKDMLDDFLVHDVGGCSRSHWRNLRGIKPGDVSCNNCGSKKIAIWHQKQCVYAYSGKIEYPLYGTAFGEKVRGPK